MTRPLRACKALLLFGLAASPRFCVAQYVIATVPTGTSPYAIAANAVTNQIYVANYGSNTVTVIDGATNNPTTVGVGTNPQAVAVNSTTNKIYVANYGSNTVTVIDGWTNDTATVNVGVNPQAIAINPATNKIYLANNCASSSGCSSAGIVTVIDGATNQPSPITVGRHPYAVALNPVTNKIYVTTCGSDPTCASPWAVTVIDGADNSTASVNVGSYTYDVEVNSVTNKVYAVNASCASPLCYSQGTVTVIDGVTNNTTTVTAGNSPYSAVVNSRLNRVYVMNLCGVDYSCQSGTVTVIDGATNNTATVQVGRNPPFAGLDTATNKLFVANTCGWYDQCQEPGSVSTIDELNDTNGVAVGTQPYHVAVNSETNRIYVGNYADNTVSVIAGDSPQQFVPLTPCRVVDTRNPDGDFGGPPIQGGTYRPFYLWRGGCDIPQGVTNFSLNVTVVPHGPLGYLTLWPDAQHQPAVSTLNSLDGRIKANAAVVTDGFNGAIDVYASDTTDVILDINGYFAPVGGSTLAFYPLTPCRVFDTRKADGDLGGPYLQAKMERQIPILEATACNIPSSAQAYSLNFTAVPLNGGPLGYLTVWPTGQSQPLASTLNDLTGTIVANAAIVPTGAGGNISVYPSNDTNLVGDINGYFAPAGAGGLSLYTGAPCRVLDTRKVGGGQPFNGELNPPVDVVGSPCGIPGTAQAYVFNATVVPQGALGYLTLWPDGDNQPLVSTLNALDGAITSNMAIVPSSNGKVDAYASGTTQLILDISSYFAP